MPEADDRPRLLYVPCDSEDQAVRIAEDLLHLRLAACANVVPGVRSLYRWEGTVRRDVEVLLLLKTRHAKVARAIDRIVEQHSYGVPAVSVVPVEDCSDAFRSWLLEETSAAAD